MSCAYKPSAANASDSACSHPQLGQCLTKQHYNNDHTIKLPKKVVVMFFRDGCPHCEHLKPDYEQASKSNTNSDITFAYVNTSKNPELMQLIGSKTSPFQVEGVPTLVSYNNGRFFSKFGGARTTDNLLKYASTIGTADVTFLNK